MDRLGVQHIARGSTDLNQRIPVTVGQLFRRYQIAVRVGVES